MGAEVPHRHIQNLGSEESKPPFSGPRSTHFNKHAYLIAERKGTKDNHNMTIVQLWTTNWLVDTDFPDRNIQSLGA